MSDPLAYKLKDAAVVSGQSVDTIKRAIAATDPESWPPPLKAKRAGRSNSGHLVVLRTELLRWVESWPDA